MSTFGQFIGVTNTPFEMKVSIYDKPTQFKNMGFINSIAFNREHNYDSFLRVFYQLKTPKEIFFKDENYYGMSETMSSDIVERCGTFIIYDLLCNLHNDDILSDIKISKQQIITPGVEKFRSKSVKYTRDPFNNTTYPVIVDLKQEFISLLTEEYENYLRKLN